MQHSIEKSIWDCSGASGQQSATKGQCAEDPLNSERERTTMRHWYVQAASLNWNSILARKRQRK
jgi:hypothetical protein